MTLFSELTKVINQTTSTTEIDPMIISRSISLANALTMKMRTENIETRNSDIPVHVSTALKLCPRQLYYLRKNPEYKVYETSEEVVVFALGRAIEALNRKYLIDIFGKENIYGRWTCLCGKTEIVGFGVNPHNVKCRSCNTTVITTYEEWPVTSQGLIIGNPDLLIKMGTELVVIEIKSMAGKLFGELEAPNADHLLQAYYYTRILTDHYSEFFKQFGLTISQEPEIIYTSKDYNKFRKTYNHKSFVMNFKEGTPYQWAIDNYNKAVTDIKSVVAGFKPPREICSSESCERAKKCPMMVRCFADGD